MRDFSPTAGSTSLECDDLAIVVRVAGGFDGAFQVTSMLRTRRYHVRRLSIAVADDGCAVLLLVTDVLSTEQMRLLLARLSRLPVVLTAALT